MGVEANSGAVPVRAMAAILHLLAPQKLGVLRAQFPGSEALFDTTMTMGAADEGKPFQPAAAPIRALIEESIAVLGPAIQRAQVVLGSRIASARQYRLAGALVAAICSAGAVATMGRTIVPVGYAVSVIAILGSIAVLIGEHLEKPVVGGAKSASELLGSTLTAETELHDIRLDLLTADLTQQDQLVAMARKVSRLSASVKEISIFGGVAMA
jgi:hypothetical protein